MIPEPIRPIIRKAILQVLNDFGGVHNHDEVAVVLVAKTHRVASRDVAEQMRWLAAVPDAQLVEIEEVGPFLTARILADGRDVAESRLAIEGIWRHPVGD